MPNILTGDTNVDICRGGWGVELPGGKDDESVRDHGGRESVGETKEVHRVKWKKMAKKLFPLILGMDQKRVGGGKMLDWVL